MSNPEQSIADHHISHYSQITINLNGKDRNLYYRDIAADKFVIKQNLEIKEYSTHHLKRNKDVSNYYQQLLQQGITPLIIDCGANIGTSVLYYHAIYPQAHIIAIEPEQENFKLLSLNTMGLSMTLVNKGVASHSGEMYLIDDGGGPFAYRLCANLLTENKVAVISIPEILSSIPNSVPFIIKIDIEGGEQNLFSSNTDWFDSFYLAVIELHDWLYPAEKISLPFIKLISQLNRDFITIGENIFSIKNPPS